MKKREYFILGFTLFVGICSGAYLYVTSFVPDYVVEEIEEVSEIAFRLQGQMTGGCAMRSVCPSFVLNQDRSYEYIPAYILQEGESKLIIGKLKQEIFEEVVEKVKKMDIAVLQKSNTKGCNAYVDGTDYEYSVTYQGEVYELYTCGMDFNNSTLEKEFRPLWQHLATSSARLPLILEEGLGGFIRI